jgi:hypothetical protein
MRLARLTAVLILLLSCPLLASSQSVSKNKCFKVIAVSETPSGFPKVILIAQDTFTIINQAQQNELLKVMEREEQFALLIQDMKGERGELLEKIDILHSKHQNSQLEATTLKEWIKNQDKKQSATRKLLVAEYAKTKRLKRQNRVFKFGAIGLAIIQVASVLLK